MVDSYLSTKFDVNSLDRFLAENAFYGQATARMDVRATASAPLLTQSSRANGFRDPCFLFIFNSTHHAPTTQNLIEI